MTPPESFSATRESDVTEVLLLALAGLLPGNALAHLLDGIESAR